MDTQNTSVDISGTMLTIGLASYSFTLILWLPFLMMLRMSYQIGEMPGLYLATYAYPVTIVITLMVSYLWRRNGHYLHATLILALPVLNAVIMLFFFWPTVGA